MAQCRTSAVLGFVLGLLVIPCGSGIAYPQTGDAVPEIDSVKRLLDNKNYERAKKLAEQNIQAAGAVHAWEAVLQNYEALITADSVTRDFGSALKHLNAKEKISQKLYISQKEQIINNVLKRQPVEAMYRQIADMDEAIGKIERSIRLRKRIIAALSAVACVMLAVAVTQAYRYKKSKSVNDSWSSGNDRNSYQLEELTRLIDVCYEDNQHLTDESDRLEKGNAVKDKLLSIISHDLRSPMSSLQALLNLFNANNIARTNLVDFFGKLLSRVENTSTMLENLLHWSQYQLKGLEPISDRVDLQKIIDECINLYRMQAEQKHIIIDNSLKTTVHVCADVEMLKVILRNLISNALKFTHSGGIITIKAMTRDSHAIISVKDTGVGIKPENQAKMFAVANFTTPGTEKEKGTGLGLVLCKDFVEHNHGKIWLDSKVNVGTTFYFNIPIAE